MGAWGKCQGCRLAFYQVVSPGARRFGKSSPKADEQYIYNSRATPDHGLRRGFQRPVGFMGRKPYILNGF
jgi:hypothetical protein